jgi:REP element-mobilizing transposase RayT
MPGTFSNLSFQIVFSTKDRIPVMKKSVRKVLFPYIGGVFKGLGGVVMTIGGMPDHLHVIVRLPTDLPVADAVRTIKSNSSKWMNEQSREMKFGWQRGYSAFSVSRSAVPRVVHFVRNQEKHHRHHSFEDELRALLTKHEIGFDNRFLC